MDSIFKRIIKFVDQLVNPYKEEDKLKKQLKDFCDDKEEQLQEDLTNYIKNPTLQNLQKLINFFNTLWNKSDLYLNQYKNKINDDLKGYASNDMQYQLDEIVGKLLENNTSGIGEAIEFHFSKEPRDEAKRWLKSLAEKYFVDKFIDDKVQEVIKETFGPLPYDQNLEDSSNSKRNSSSEFQRLVDGYSESLQFSDDNEFNLSKSAEAYNELCNCVCKSLFIRDEIGETINTSRLHNLLDTSSIKKQFCRELIKKGYWEKITTIISEIILPDSGETYKSTHDILKKLITPLINKYCEYWEIKNFNLMTSEEDFERMKNEIQGIALPKEIKEYSLKLLSDKIEILKEKKEELDRQYEEKTNIYNMGFFDNEHTNNNYNKRRQDYRKYNNRPRSRSPRKIPTAVGGVIYRSRTGSARKYSNRPPSTQQGKPRLNGKRTCEIPANDRQRGKSI